MHILRCAPCINNPLLFIHDSLLWEGISIITNSCVRDIHWIQASLPIRDGGLSIQCVSLLALSACLASAVNTLDLQVDLHARRLQCQSIQHAFLRRLGTPGAHLTPCHDQTRQLLIMNNHGTNPRLFGKSNL